MTHTWDIKFLYVAFGHRCWSTNDYFSIFCKCRKDQQCPYHHKKLKGLQTTPPVKSCQCRKTCDLTTGDSYRDHVKLAIAKANQYGDDRDSFLKWVHTHNFGIRDDGPLVPYLNPDRFFADTYHMKSNLSISG